MSTYISIHLWVIILTSEMYAHWLFLSFTNRESILIWHTLYLANNALEVAEFI